MMSGDHQGLSYLSWDIADGTMADGMSLVEFTIVYRKVLKDQAVEYSLMSPDNKSLKVTLEDVSEGGGDPLRGVHSCQMALDDAQTRVTAVRLADTVFVRR